MLRDRLKRLNYQHTVMGALLGWLLYLVNFSGSVAMFAEEFQVWEEPAARANAAEAVPMQSVIDSFSVEIASPLSFLEVTRPEPGNSLYQLRARYIEGETSRSVERTYEVATGREITRRNGHGVARWLEHLHRYLAIQPKNLGRILVGLTGVYMLVLALSGVVIHRRILRDLYKIRWGRSARLKWKDLHNATGLWTLPFSLVIAFTGVMVGAPPLIALVAAMSLTGGDFSKVEELEELLIGVRHEESWEGEMNMVSADDAMYTVAEETDFNPIGVRIERYGDRNASYFVLADSPRELVYAAPVPINASTGAVEMERYAPLVDGIPESVSARIFSASTPLHYGLFGSLALKCLYYVLGMVISICIAVGMLIYFERRLGTQVGHFSNKTYLRLSRVNAGLVAGLPVVTLLMFYIDRALMASGEYRYTALAAAFFGGWFVCAGYALFVRTARRAARRLMGITVMLGLLLPLFDFVTMDGGFGNEAVLVVHGVSVFSALCLLSYLLTSSGSWAVEQNARSALQRTKVETTG